MEDWKKSIKHQLNKPIWTIETNHNQEPQYSSLDQWSSQSTQATNFSVRLILGQAIIGFQSIKMMCESTPSGIEKVPLSGWKCL